MNTLDWNVSVPKGKVTVVVEEGWITLTGDVDWNFQREAAHNAVRHLMGVKAVTNLIKLNVPDVSTAEVRAKIDSALKRIEDGSYGYCEETGEPIGIAARIRSTPYRHIGDFYCNSQEMPTVHAVASR